MTREELLAFVRSEPYAVQASVGPDGRPQAAVVGIAVSDDFEIIFDTVDWTRKARNLRTSPMIAFVIGGCRDGDERTVQLEGVADVPVGDDLRRVREVYLARFPDGQKRLRWRGLIHVRVRPTWVRYSNFNTQPPEIVELDVSSW